MFGSKKIIIPIAAFLSGTAVGAAGLMAAQHKESRKQMRSTSNIEQSVFGDNGSHENIDDFQNDIFASFKRQRDEMNRMFKNMMSEISHADPYTEQLATSRDLDDVDVKDTGSEFVYRIPLDGGAKDKKVDVRVSHGMVTVTAEGNQSEKSEKGDAKEISESMSEFQKTFPLIAGANPAKMDFKVENDSIVIRFPKLKGV